MAAQSKNPSLTLLKPGARTTISASAPKKMTVLAVEIRTPRFPSSREPPCPDRGSGSPASSTEGPVISSPCDPLLDDEDG